MSQQSSANNTQEVVQKPDANWDFVLKELQRIDGLKSNLLTTNINVNKIKDDVELIKTLNKIDQKSQSQIQQEQNVIEEQEISSTLSTSQKKRYENIGAEFVKGAGKQFDKIKKAIQFREKMKTSNDKFVQEVKKNKQNVKKQAKKSGFWTKLLAIMGVVAMVAIMFRDKISKLLPDFSKGTNDLGSNIISSFTGLVKHFSTIAIKFIGGGIATVIDRVCVEIIPNIISGFFHETLPVVMVATTLSVLSMFSESAGTQLEKLLGNQSNEAAQSTLKAADAQISGGKSNYGQGIIGVPIQQLRKKPGGLSRSHEQVGNALYKDANGFGQDDAARKTIDALIKINPQLKKMIEAGDVSITQLYQGIARINNTIPSNDVIGRQTAYLDFLSGYLLAPNDGVGKQNLQSWIAANVTQNNDLLALAAQSMMNNATYKAIATAMRKDAVNNIGNINVSPQLNTVNQGMSFVTHVNVQEAMLASFADGVNDVLVAINNFLNGNQSTTNFLRAVDNYFITLEKECTQFFTKNYSSLYGILTKALGFFASGNLAGSSPSKPQKPTFEVHDYGKDSKDNPFLWNSNVLVLNVQVNDINSLMIGNMLHEISSVDKSIQTEIEKSITSLDNINKLLQKQIVIKKGEPVEVDLSGVNDRLDKHNQRLNTLQGKGNKGKPSQPSGSGNAIEGANGN